jgi:ankyrin repeat protein
VSQCRELCRLTRDIVQRGDVADMLAQSLRLQCGAREARAAAREPCRIMVSRGGNLMAVFPQQSTTQLIRSASLNNLPRVLQLIQLGAPLDVGDENGYSALDWACDMGHEHVAKALLDGKFEGRGAAVDVRSIEGRTPLMSASYSGREAVVRLLLSRGAKQELHDIDGETALHHAVCDGYDCVVAVLCAAPGATAALASRRRDGFTPLALAIHHGHGACEAVLRAHGAKL